MRKSHSLNSLRALSMLVERFGVEIPSSTALDLGLVVRSNG
jgi:hypothetical protein